MQGKQSGICWRPGANPHWPALLSVPLTNLWPLENKMRVMRRTRFRINPKKAAYLYNILGRELRDCSKQLADVLTDIFNTSVSQAVFPESSKKIEMISAPRGPQCTTVWFIRSGYLILNWLNK